MLPSKSLGVLGWRSRLSSMWSIFLGREKWWGCFPCLLGWWVLNSLRNLVFLLIKSSKNSWPAWCWSPGREVGQPKDCWAEKGHTSWGGIGMWGMRDCRLLVWVGTCDEVFPVVWYMLAWLGILLPGWSSVPTRGWPTAESDEQCGLRPGGSWKVCTQFVIFLPR